MARTMTDEDRRAFLSHGTRTGKLATTLADGRPHVVPIWFVVDNDDIVFTTHETSAKGKALRRDPRAALCVDEEVAPYAFVLVQGAVALSDDFDEMLLWATRIGGRYMGADRAEEFGRRNAVEGELLVRLTPAKLIAQAGVSD